VKEVVARIRAVTRRCLRQKPGQEREAFRMCDLEVIPPKLRARRGNREIELSLREVRILDCLERNRGRVVDRNTLLDECWGIDYLPNSRTLDQHIAQLRKKIENDPRDPRIIKTVHGAGYRFEEPK
jgi:DNA-binding response OmpR family regulator